METALLAVGILNLAGLFILWRLLSELRDQQNLDWLALMQEVKEGNTTASTIVSDTEEIKEVLTEASRIKAIREASKPDNVPPRAPVRQRAFTGIAQRRAQAEIASLQGKTHQEQVRKNDIHAMEGR